MKEELKKIYQDTKEICASIAVPESVKYNMCRDVEDKRELVKTGNVIVEPLDTVSALVKYHTSGKTAVLNMASSKRKGGGVENGAMAQEECLFRCSNLFTISDTLYPIQMDEYIYTKDATFVKDFNYNQMEPIMADVITMPAINLNRTHIDIAGDEVQLESPFINTMYLQKMFYMLNAAIANDCDNIILGAWGCGVFNNDPKNISKLFKEIINGRESKFKNIIFAVINDKNSVANNYQIFKETF